MSIECRNAWGMRKKAVRMPEASVTATLMRMPNASACAMAAWQASEAADAVITEEGTERAGDMKGKVVGVRGLQPSGTEEPAPPGLRCRPPSKRRRRATEGGSRVSGAGG